jgi:Putative Na+/H+ antiporter
MDVFPRALDGYPADATTLVGTLAQRVAAEPFNLVATGIFLLAILHTFTAARFARLAHDVQRRHDVRCRANGHEPAPSVLAETLHFLGEVEVVFGLWAIVLLVAVTATEGWTTAKGYFNGTVNYTEALFVVVIMALASTRPIIRFAESALSGIAQLGRGTPAAWWVTILTIGPLLGSFITEPAAMTICALLLARHFFGLEPSRALKYATLGLLFVNVSIGGTLTHFAAPPVLMVARPWGWDTAFMLGHFGWRAALGIALSTSAYYLWFRSELRSLANRARHVEVEEPDEESTADAQSGEPGPSLLPVPAWVIAMHVFFMAWTVFNAHYPALFLGGFLIFLGFAKATARYQARMDLRAPLLVGFFLAGLVIHGGLQGWWIAPVLGGLSQAPLFLSSTFLTAFNDNALITYLATLVPHLDDRLKIAVVEGAVTGGGLTVIANAPNPAGQALLARFFDNAIAPLLLLAGALLPTVLAGAAFFLT